MRQDQFERLQALSEKLMDRFLAEADPDEWPGAGLKIGAMDPQTRGDLYWTKKNGAATGMLYTRVEAMIGATQMAGGMAPAAADGEAEHESQLDDEIRAAEREAARLMKDLTGGAKSTFDKRVHGRSAG